MKRDKNTFILSSEYESFTDNMTDEEAGRLFKIILHYENCGEVGEIPAEIKMVWAFIKMRLDENREAYKAACEAHREAREGKTKKKEQKEQKITKRTNVNKQEQKPIDNDNENDNEHENDKDIKTQGAVNPELEQAIAYFIEHRKKLKKPMTDHAIDLFRERLNEMASTTQEQIALINLAIMKGWQTVYPDNENKGRASPTKKPSCPQRTYDFEALERELIKN